MIPVRLTIEGFYSYRERQVIDFERLFKAGIFGIFGSVGSGKSAVLDAVTFILYGKCERYNRDERNYNMMNLKSDKLYLELVFYASGGNELYKIVVSAQRNKKDFNKTDTYKKRVFKKSEGEWQPDESFDPEKVVGLSYGNFKKTVIIPQNQFMDFLRLTGSERSVVLKEIFKLEKYDLYPKARALRDANENELGRLQAEFEGVKEDDEEKLEETRKLISENKKQNDKISLEIEAARKEEACFAKQKDIFNKAGEAAKALEKLELGKLEFENKKKRLEKYIDVIDIFKEDVGEHDKISSKLESCRLKNNALKTRSADLEKSFSAKALLLSKLKVEYDKKEELKAKASEISIISDIKKTLSASLMKHNEIVNSQSDLNYVANKKTLLEKELDDANKAHEKISCEIDSYESLSNLSHINSFFVLYNAKKASLGEIVTEADKIKLEIDEHHKELEAIFQLFGLSSEGRSLFPEIDLIQALGSEIKALENKINDVNAELNSLMVLERLEDLSKSLKDGSACPLCGSKEHPNPYSAKHKDKRAKELSELRADFEKKLKLFHLSTGKAQTLYGVLSDKKKSFDKLLMKKENALCGIKKLEDDFNYRGYSLGDKEKAGRDLKHVSLLLKKAKEYEEQKYNFDKSLGEIKKSEEKIKAIISELEKQKSSIESKAETLKGMLKCLSYNDYLNKTQEELDIIEKSFISDYDRIKSGYNEAERVLKEIEAEQNKLKGEEISLLENISSYEKDFKNIKEKIEAKLGIGEYKSIDDIKSVISLNLDISKEKAEIEDYYNKKSLLENRLLELKKEAGSVEYNFENHKALFEEIASLSSVLEELNIKRGELNNSFDLTKNNLEKKKKLEMLIEEKLKRRENIKVLENMFKGNGFVEFIANIFLKELCNHANERFFKLTSNSLKLGVSEKGDIYITDYLNGGKMRSIKSLSGGQTFQASLCLALALSKSVATLAVSDKSFFFLDEGFGTLDSTALKDVYLTLNSLRKENRIIGIISHVEELQQEIETYLKINNSELRGSIISQSWE